MKATPFPLLVEGPAPVPGSGSRHFLEFAVLPAAAAAAAAAFVEAQVLS